MYRRIQLTLLTLVLLFVAADTTHARARFFVEGGGFGWWLDGTDSRGDQSFDITAPRYESVSIADGAGGFNYAAVEANPIGYALDGKGFAGFYGTVGAQVAKRWHVFMAMGLSLGREGRDSFSGNGDSTEFHRDISAEVDYRSEVKAFYFNLGLEYHPDWQGVFVTASYETAILLTYDSLSWQFYDDGEPYFTRESGHDWCGSGHRTIRFGLGYLSQLSDVFDIRSTVTWGPHKPMGGFQLDLGLRAYPF